MEQVVAGTNASQSNEDWEQKAAHDVIRTTQRFDSGGERMIEGRVSSRRRFLLVVVGVVLSTFIVTIVKMNNETTKTGGGNRNWPVLRPFQNPTTVRTISSLFPLASRVEIEHVQDGFPSGKQRGAASCPPQYRLVRLVGGRIWAENGVTIGRRAGPTAALEVQPPMANPLVVHVELYGEKASSDMEMGEREREGSAGQRRGGIGDSFGSTREMAALGTH